MRGNRLFVGMGLAFGATATAALAAPDGVPAKTLTAFQTFRLALASPGYDIKPPPPNLTIYPQSIRFDQPARVEPKFNTVWMNYDAKSVVLLNVGPDQANKLLTHSWDITCRVRNVSKLAIRRTVSGAPNPAAILTFETPVVNDTATFTVPNYSAAMNAIAISTRPEYKANDYFAWGFDWCDVKPVAKLKVTALPQPKP